MSITAWRYWRIESDGYDFTDKRWDWSLRGDFEKWEGPLKEAGSHDHIYSGWLSLNFEETGKDQRHESPLAGCLCGVNAVKRLRSEDLQMRAGNGSLFGFPWRIAGTVAFAQVDLGGKVDEYEEGYRARQALISGPIYVVNPPTGPGWREAIERRYGQPVIVQEYEEAIDWIRKDEEANGHREAHQDARAGAAGGPFYAGRTLHIPAGTWTITNNGITRAGGTVPLANSTSGTTVGALTSALVAGAKRADDAKRARERRRARARLIHRWVLRVGFAFNAGLAAAFATVESPLLVFNVAAASVFGWMAWLDYRSPGPVTWDQLKKWAKEHGAKNDDITEIEITRTAGSDRFAVELEGMERDAKGNAYTVGLGNAQDVATWRTTSILRRLP